MVAFSAERFQGADLMRLHAAFVVHVERTLAPTPHTAKTVTDLDPEFTFRPIHRLSSTVAPCDDMVRRFGRA